MQKKEVSNLIKTVVPYLSGIIIGLVIALIVILTSGCFIETKEVINQPYFLDGELILSNSTVTGMSDIGNGVINLLSGFLIVIGFIAIILCAVDLFYLRRKDGV